MLNIVIPMAGRGSRFSDAGFTDPKPYIAVDGIPMIERVIQNLRPSCPHRFIFVCQKSHLEYYGLRQKLKALVPDCIIVSLHEYTAGSACSVLMASDYIDNSNSLLIANADQLIDNNIDHFLKFANDQCTDGLIMTMIADSPKWSYVLKDSEGNVCKVVEKDVVSSEATVGIYHFRQGSDFCREARDMICYGERTLNEYYVAPVYTRLYRNGQTVIKTFDIGDGMHGLGTPEDLELYLLYRAKLRICNKIGDSSRESSH